nr:MAG TPA: hypothetical protein [Caudoviricetes sp.]
MEGRGGRRRCQRVLAAAHGGDLAADGDARAARVRLLDDGEDGGHGRPHDLFGHDPVGLAVAEGVQDPLRGVVRALHGLKGVADM